MQMASSSNIQPLRPMEDEEDYERILRLLQAKVHGEPLPTDANVHECDMYGEKNPWEIWELFGGGKDGSRELYFFTTIRMNLSSTEVVRTIGCGLWEDQRNDGALVYEDTIEQLAVKKCFLFGKSGTSHDGAWIMHEYRLVSSDHPSKPPSEKPSSDFSHVLCKLIKNQGRIRVRRMDQSVTIMLPFPANPSASTTNRTGALRLVDIGNQKEAVDKRITVEERTAEERLINTESSILQEIVGDMLNSMEEHDATGEKRPPARESSERFDD